MTAREWLGGLDAARSAGTPGRWMHDSHELYQEMPDVPGISGEWLGETCRIPGDPLHATSEPDAALIVAAVNALPELTYRLRVVLDLADDLDARARSWAEEADKSDELKRAALLGRILGAKAAAQRIRAAADGDAR